MSVIDYTPANDDHEKRIDNAFMEMTQGEITEEELIEIISTPGAVCMRCGNWEDDLDRGDICWDCEYQIEGTKEEGEW